MCGINGILYLNSHCSGKDAGFYEEKIKKMNEAVKHRGPDGKNLFINYPVCLGHTRLSIIDLSDSASQPMLNEDRTIAVVFNGAIYNYIELISELKQKGHSFKSKSDTEVIIHSYEEYGFDCVNKFNGMWAFVIYDFRKNILFASRDRFGVKPFYYYADEKNFIFSSEIKSILKVKTVRDANHGKVYDYLAYGYKTSNGETFFRNIYELKPAHNIVIEDNKVNMYKYWDFENRLSVPENEILDFLNFLITDSIQIRFRSDVPVSILLSGGLDSRMIAKIADELIEDRKLDQNISAYSAVFPGFKYDESLMIDEFIRSCRHITSVKIIPEEINLLESINEFIFGMGEPVFSPSVFAHYTIMKEIKQHGIKVVLNGQGADEAWAGYDRYIVGYFLLDLLFASPHLFLSQMQAINSGMKFSYKYILSQTVKAILSRRYASFLRSKYKERIFSVLSKDFIRKNYFYFTNSHYKKLSSSNLKEYLKYNIQYQGFNQILHYEDHSSMQNSIETRSPFVDYRLMELAFSIPGRKKIDNGSAKKILKEICSEKLPGLSVNNHSKIGFMTPFDDWLNKSHCEKFLGDLINSESFRSKQIWNSKRMLKIFNERKKDGAFPYWRVINLELWSQAYEINNI